MIIAFLFGALLIRLAGGDVVAGYIALAAGAFGSESAISETLLKTTPLLMATLGSLIAFRARVWNIGAEGQFYAGALGATWAAVTISGLPLPLHLALVVILGFVGGAAWASIAGALKVKLGVNEILTTLMSNFIMLLFTTYLLFGPWMDPSSAQPQSSPFLDTGRLPRLVPTLRVNGGLIMALIVAAAVYVTLRKTVLGYRIRCVGESLEASKYAGINVPRIIFLVMLLSGGIAGLAGMTEVAGVQYRMRPDISPATTPYGYTSILIAFLGGLDPLWSALASFLFAGLITGGDTMQIAISIPTSVIPVIQTTILLTVLAGEVLVRYRVRLR